MPSTWCSEIIIKEALKNLFLKFKNRLILFIQIEVEKQVSQWMQMEKQRKLSLLRGYENTIISTDFHADEHCTFVIDPVVKKFEIKGNVSCRKFCTFLVYPGASLTISENVFFNNACSVNCLGEIEIGRNTLFGEGVKLYDHNHLYKMEEGGSLKVEREKFKIGKIKIGQNCWIGSNVTILNNVEIGDNVIIGANCLVHQNIPSNSIVKQKTEYIINTLS